MQYIGLMITASYQAFSGQTKHLSSQIKFDPTNLLYVINGEVIKFTKDNKCLVLIINTGICRRSGKFHCKKLCKAHMYFNEIKTHKIFYYV